MSEYCFTSLSAQPWQYHDRRKPGAGTMPCSYFEWHQGFFIVHSAIGSTVHSMPLNSLEHCICTTTITNIRPDRDSSLVTPGYKTQSIRMGRLMDKSSSQFIFANARSCTVEILREHIRSRFFLKIMVHFMLKIYKQADKKNLLYIISPFSATTVFIRQDLTSVDVIFWLMKTVPHWKN